MKTWNAYVNLEEVADTVSYYNQKVGISRHVTAETAVKVVEQAFNYYDYLEGREKSDAISYDLQSFCEYATTAFNVEDSLEFSDRYSPLLASGHPRGLRPIKSEIPEWIAGAPELDGTARSAIIASLSPEADEDLVRHAHVRLSLMAQDGRLSPATMVLLEEALTKN
jgi:hypothetical protein